MVGNPVRVGVRKRQWWFRSAGSIVTFGSAVEQPYARGRRRHDGGVGRGARRPGGGRSRGRRGVRPGRPFRVLRAGRTGRDRTGPIRVHPAVRHRDGARSRRPRRRRGDGGGGGRPRLSAGAQVQAPDGRVARVHEQRQAVPQRDPVLRADRAVPAGPRAGRRRPRAAAVPVFLRPQRLRRSRAGRRDRPGERRRPRVPDVRRAVAPGLRPPCRGSEDAGQVSTAELYRASTALEHDYRRSVLTTTTTTTTCDVVTTTVTLLLSALHRVAFKCIILGIRFLTESTQF